MKLTKEDIISIRASKAPIPDIAVQYNITEIYVNMLKRMEHHSPSEKSIKVRRNKTAKEIANAIRLAKKRDFITAIRADTRPHDIIAHQYNVSPATVQRYKNMEHDSIVNASEPKAAPLSELTEEQIHSIYEDKRKMTAIGYDYNLSESMVSLIKKGKRYKRYYDAHHQPKGHK